MNKQQVLKPFSLVRDELMNEVITAINKSGLSYTVLEYIFKDILNGIHSGAVEQARAEQAEYRKTLQANPKSEDADK